MENWRDIIKKQQTQRVENNGLIDPTKDALGALRQVSENMQEKRKANSMPSFDGNMESALNENQNRDAQLRQQDSDYAKKYAPNQEYNAYQPNEIEGSQDLNWFHEDWSSKISKSLVSGVGDVVKGWGDAIQFATSLGYMDGNDGWDSNPLQVIGDLLHEQGELDTRDSLDLSKEQDLVALISNPDFWLTQAPKMIPQLADTVLVGRGMGGALKKGIQAGGKAAMLKAVASSADDVERFAAKSFLDKAGQAVKGTTKGVYQGADKVNEIAGSGKGLLSRVYTDTGKFTKTFDEIAGGVTGGAAMNIKLGMQNGTEVYNTYANLEDPKTGQKLFSEQEAGEMARNTMLNQMYYMGVDIASYMMVFGKNNALKSSIVNNSDVLKKMSKIFSGTNKYLPTGALKVAGQAGFEGVEESFQESWEEWAKAKAYFQKVGSFENYQGKVPEKFKTEDDLNFWDFYTSNENKTTRNLSGVLGALMGGTFNIKDVVNKSANDTFNTYRRADSLSRRAEKGTQDDANQIHHINSMMNEMIMQNKEDQFVPFISHLNNKEVITDDEMEYFKSNFNKLALKANEVRGLDSLNGKVAFMENYAEEIASNDHINTLHKKMTEAIEFHKKNIKDPKQQAQAIKREKENFKTAAELEVQKIIVHQNNQQQLLAGKPAMLLETIIDGDYADPKIKVKDRDEGQKATASYRNKLKREAKFKTEQMSESNNTDILNNDVPVENQNKSVVDSIIDTASEVGNKVVSVVDSLYKKGTEAYNKYQQDSENRKYDPNNISELDESSYKSFKEGNPVEQPILNNIAKKLLEGKELTLEEQEVNDANKSVIDSKLANAKTQAQPKQYANATEQEKDNIRVFRDVKNNPDSINTMSDEDFDVLDRIDNDENTNKQVQRDLALIENAVDKVIKGDELTSEELEVVAKHPEIFQEVAKENKLENSEQALSDAVVNSSNLSQEEKLYFDRSSQRDTKQKQESKQEERARKLSEFNEQRRINKEVEKDVRAEEMKAVDTSEEVQQTEEEVQSEVDADIELAVAEYSAGVNLDKAVNFLKENLNSIKDKYPKIYSKIKKEKIKDAALNLFNKAKTEGNKVINKAVDTTHLMYPPSRLSQVRAVERRLEVMYPNANILISTVNDMYKTMGIPHTALAVNGMIFVDTNSWDNNNSDFFHEVAHIHFNLSRDTANTKSLIKEYLKNKPLVNYLENLYSDQILYDVHKSFRGRKLPGTKTKTSQEIISEIEKEIGSKLSPEEVKNALNILVDDGIISLKPITEQEIILDELFAVNMEHDFDKNFKNKFFDSYSEQEIIRMNEDEVEDKRSALRRFIETKTGIDYLRRKSKALRDWLKSLKEQTQEMIEQEDPALSIIEKYIEDLSPSNQRKFYDKRERAINSFLKGSKSKNYTNPSIRYKILKQLDEDQQKHENYISDKIKEQNKINLKRRADRYKPSSKVNNQENTEEDLLENSLDSYQSEELFNHNRTLYLNATSKLLKQFSKLYNKSLRARYLAGRAKGDSWNIPTFDGDQMMVDLHDLAKANNSSESFIAALENSEYEELFEFNDFMDSVRSEDKYSYLNNFWMLSKNMHTVDAVQTYINSDGKVDVQSSLSMREKFQDEKNFQNVMNAFTAFRKFMNQPQDFSNSNYNNNLFQYQVGRYDNFKNAVVNIQNDNLTDKDIYAVASFLGATPQTIKENSIYLDGKLRALDSVIVKLALDFDLDKNSIVNNVLDKDGKQVYQNGKAKTEINPLFRKVVRGLVVSDRRNRADFTVMNAEGNQVPTRQVENALIRRLNEMTEDAKSYKTVKGFINKYSRVKGEGVMSNKFLEHIYNQANSGQDIRVSQFLGIKNDKDSNYSDFTNANGNDNSINEFLMYLNTGDRTNSYLMDTGRYADSPVSYLMEVPKLKLSDYFKIKDGKIRFSGEQVNYFKHTLNAFNNFLPTESRLKPLEAVKMLEQSISNETDFLNNNILALNEMSSMQKYLSDDKKSLNQLGNEMVASYVLNNWVNQTHFNQSMLPDVSGSDIVKRSKLLRSPSYNFKNTKFETLYFKDDVESGNKMDDSGMYILREDAQRIQDSFGNLMQVGLGYKLLHAGIEQSNPLFKGKNFFDKGYTTILDEDYIKNNPRLRGLYEALKARRQKYIDQVGQDNFEESLTSGKTSYLALAVPLSSVKIKNAQKENILPKSFNENDSAFSLDDYNTNGGNIDSNLHKTWNEAYYNGNQFMGLDGSNLGVQNSLDKYRDEINMPVQLSKFILTNGSLNSNITALEDIQNDIVNLQEKQLSEITDELLNGNFEQAQNLLMNSIDENFVDSLQLDLLKKNLSLNIPAVRNLAINTFINKIRKAGNKLRTPGTIAQQKPSKHIKTATDLDGNSFEVFTNVDSNALDYVNYMSLSNDEKNDLSKEDKLRYRVIESEVNMSDVDSILKYQGDNLKYYSENSDGTTKPGEVVIPNYLRDKVKVRKYHIFNNSDKTNLEYYADPKYGYEHPDKAKIYAESLMKYAKEENRIPKKMTVEEYMDNYKVLNKKGFVVGFYVPGDLVNATRVPSHGPQSTGFFEAIDYDSTGASQVQLPSEFALNTTGGDYDGDQVFMQFKQANNPYNKIFDKMSKHWLSAEMRNEITKNIEFEDETNAALEIIEKQLGNESSNYLLGTPESRRQAFNNTIVSKNNIGSAANYHSYLSMMSAYNTQLEKAITIDGKKKNIFSDYSNAQKSRTIDSAKIFNIILDNAKYQYADRLGINEQTVGDALILTNLGFDLSQVGLVLNSNKYKDYVKAVSSKRNSFASVDVDVDLDSSSDININTKDINSSKNDKSLEALISLLSQVKSDMSDLSKIMGGHNRIESDPFVLSQQIENFETLLDNNKQGQVIDFSKIFKNNPLVQNYLNVAKDSLSVREKFDPVSRKDYKEVYGNITNSSTRNINDNQKRTIHDDMEKVALSRLLGFNNISEDYKKSLTDPKSENNIFDRIGNIIADKKSKIVKGTTIDDIVTEYDTSLLFSKALSVITEGNNKFVSLRSSYYNEMTTDGEKQLAIDEFNQLDNNLKKDLLLYDMMVNGWEGRKSLFHLMDDNFKKEISKLSDNDIKNKDNISLPQSVKNEIEFAIAEKNQSMYDTIAFNPFPRNSSGDIFLNNTFSKAQKGESGNKIWNKLKKGEKVSFFYFDRKNGKKWFMQFKGFNPEQIAELRRQNMSSNNSRLFDVLNNMANSFFTKGNSNFFIKEVRDSYKENIGYERLTSIKDKNTNPESDPFEKIRNMKGAHTYLEWMEQMKSSNKNIRFKKDFYLFENRMNQNQFNGAMEFPSFVSDSDRKIAFDYYSNERTKAEIDYQKYNDETIPKMETKEILDLYNKYANLDQFAYSNILTPLVKEVAKRISAEQTEKYTQIKSDGRDISVIQKYFMSNNIPSNHPMVQGLVRNMENAFKTFTKEQTDYQNKLKDATNELYKEQLGYSIKDNSITDKIKALFDYLFKNKEEFYTKLYGPLITYDNIMKVDPQGKTYAMKVMRYKDESQIEEDYQNKIISEGQYNFYKATKEISKDLVQFQDLKKGERSGFIPHVSPGQMEAFSRRGLLGLMNISKPIEQSIGDVRMNFKNPITGEEVLNVSMKDIEFFFSNDMIAKGNKSANAKELYKLRNKAFELLKKGMNEDGSKIHISDMEAGTVMGNTFSDRFSNSGSKQSNNFVTMDLDKAFGDYIHSTLFINGNKNFQGMKSMLPMIDGALSMLDTKGQDKMKDYVQSIWKDNFLKGAKKNTIWTPDQLKSVGLSSDKVVDYITRGSLVYWLGYKGLALGGGLYAIGNILSGKFSNIAHAGGKDWRRGESRFWLGRSGKFDIKNPMKGVHESNQILKEMGFMDINIYDDVSITKKNSFEGLFMSLALMPMSYSEKWIQGAHFLGLLSDKEWEAVLKDGKNGLPVERLNELENTVKLSHGKGYQVNDQRMIQMYSWGRAMMQFSRHIPTMFYNNLSAKDKDIYGKTHVGAYRQVYNTIQAAVVGKMKPKELKLYIDSLEGEEKRKFYAGLMGFGVLTGAAALATFGMNSKYANDLASDTNIFFDTDRLGYKLTTPPALGMLSKL